MPKNTEATEFCLLALVGPVIIRHHVEFVSAAAAACGAYVCVY